MRHSNARSNVVAIFRTHFIRVRNPTAMSEEAKKVEEPLKLPKIPQKFLAKFGSRSGSKQRNATPLPPADTSEDALPLAAEASYILIAVRDLWISVRRIAFLVCLIKDFNGISVLHGAQGLADKLTGVHHHFQYFNERLMGGAAVEAEEGDRARKILRHFQHRYPNCNDLYVTFCVVRHHQGRLCLNALAERLTSYRQLLAVELRTSKADDRNRKLRLERSRIAIVRYEAALDAYRKDIEKAGRGRNEQIYRKCDQITQLKSDLENVTAFQAKFVEKFSQEQIEEIQRIQNHRLQQEWFMHRRIKEFSVEMKALTRANSDTEFLLRQKSNDSDEVVADLRRRYEKSLGLSDASLMETEFALQEEARLLERFRDKVQRLQEEWEEIMKKRDEEEERRKMRTAKIKKRFHLVIKTLAYFRREKQPSGSSDGDREADAESATSASPKSLKKHKKLSFKKSF